MAARVPLAGLPATTQVGLPETPHRAPVLPDAFPPELVGGLFAGLLLPPGVVAAQAGLPEMPQSGLLFAGGVLPLAPLPVGLGPWV